MSIRRIVAGSNSAGESVFLSDLDDVLQTEFEHPQGFIARKIWSTHPVPNVASQIIDAAENYDSYLPYPGETRFMVITFPPDYVMLDPSFDPIKAGLEAQTKLPGLADTFEQDSPGMHATDTIDYGIVLDGEICLDLGNGKEAFLRKNDIVIQAGNRHAWRNKSNSPATVAFVLIGAVKGEITI